VQVKELALAFFFLIVEELREQEASCHSLLRPPKAAGG
jgi:hypothetical protein